MKRDVKTHHKIVRYQAKRVYINRYQVKNFPGAWLLKLKFVNKFEFESISGQLFRTLCQPGLLNSFVGPEDSHRYFRWSLIENGAGNYFVQCNSEKKNKEHLVVIYQLIVIE